MLGDLLAQLTRREFLRVSGFAISSIPFIEPAYAQDADKTSTQKLEEMLDLDIEVKEWKPMDVTEKVKKALGGKEWEFKEASGPYPHKNWTVQSYFKAGSSNVSLPQDKFGTHFLCSAQPMRAYTLDLGDEKGLKFPVYYIHGAQTQVAENGVVVYGLENTKSKPPHKGVMANIHTGRKLIFGKKDASSTSDIFLNFELSGIGNRLLITQRPNYAVLDTSDYHIVDSGRSGVFLITYDGGSILLHKGYDHSAKNIDTKEVTFLTGQSLTKVNWVVSKNGMYWGCEMSAYPKSSLEIMVLKGGRFIIDHPLDADHIKRIDDDGTVHAFSGTYKFQDGTYIWTTEGKEQPENLRIIKTR